ncbi:MAG TPA: type II toxin-antitoxin system HicA family toxin [Candidatus Hypogeohydataceae bacterium YC38]|nr:type II toxin-antitoxin system HicA family toxin [Candidatus Brocadiales bacterium]
MQKLPVLSGKEVIKLLKRVGFSPTRQRGSHVILVKHDPHKGKRAVVVPDHKEVDKGTLLEIIRQAGLTREEFLKLHERG